MPSSLRQSLPVVTTFAIRMMMPSDESIVLLNPNYGLANKSYRRRVIKHIVEFWCILDWHG